MQTKLPPLRFSLMLLCALSLQPSTACAQGTAFTYQGRLNDGANPASGIYDLRFTICDSSGGPGVVAGPVTNSPTTVGNGLFTVTLDFGAGVFTGAERWLDIGVRTNGGGAFTALAPRQRLTAAPYAILAGNVSGTVAAAQIDPAIARAADIFPAILASDGSGSGLDADRLDGLSGEDFWRLGGNAGTTPGTHFLGTTDNQPLDLKVSNLRALRLELNGGDAPNLIGGAPDNAVGATTRGATIAGGKVNLIGTGAHFSVAGGGVGIGTTVTPVRLTVAGAGAYNAGSATALLLTNTTAGTGRGWEWHALNNGRLQLADFGAAETRILVETNGNVCIGGTGATNKLHVAGGATFASGSVGANQAVVWTPGSASWSFTSDRDAKEKIAAVDPPAVLERLLRVPIAVWNYIGYEQRHVGPMAQDFHARFPWSGDATTLNDADLHGVALAAIQGLNQKLHEQLLQKVAQLASLQQRIARLLHRSA